ncbi:MAG: alpha/beta fold hydrolase [Alphaproteobacteria bacterium]|nr:alpha/beta fold hydrolase [Alphaproteobacteria bacterium]
MILRFEDCELDTGRYEMRRGGRPVHVEPQVFDLLCLLVEHRDRVVSKDELFEKIWAGRIVSDATLGSRINAARKAIGDNGKDQRLIRTAPRRGFRFIGTIDGDEVAPPDSGSENALRQDIRFCLAPDGVRIAYATVGDGPPLVKAANWLNHLEYDWENVLWRPRLERLAEGRRLVRYDARGSGLSDWEGADISFDAFVQDLETVVDSLGLERFALWGLSQGCPVSVAYATRHAERVSHLILLGGYVRGRDRRNDPAESEKAAALRTLIRQGWGDEHSALLPALSTMIIPGATSEQVHALAEMQRRSATAENAMRIREACDGIDVVSLLPRVSVPTLVLHSRYDAVAPFEQGRLMASSIPGARFVSLESDNHTPLPGEPAWERFVAEVDAFLASS